MAVETLEEEPEAAQPPHALLGVAAEHTVTQVPTAGPDRLVSEVRQEMLGGDFESIGAVAVLDGHRLLGVIPIRRLVCASGPERLAEIMDADPPVVAPGEDQEHVAWKMIRHGQSCLAVVDADGRFMGLVPANRMLGVLLSEHDEDLARLGGYMAGTRRARRAAQERVGRRLWHRLPWLLIGLVGAMASAVIVGAFEEQLDKTVLLAFFLPGVVYMADAVGTQTEAVLIRGLSAGVTVRSVVRRELLTGAVIGLVVGAAFLPFALIGWGDADVAIAVAIALFASCSIATLVAMALPAAFQRLGTDPAFGSGPLATVVQDLLSIAVYLAIATPLAA